MSDKGDLEQIRDDARDRDLSDDEARELADSICLSVPRTSPPAPTMDETAARMINELKLDIRTLDDNLRREVAESTRLRGESARLRKWLDAVEWADAMDPIDRSFLDAYVEWTRQKENE